MYNILLGMVSADCGAWHQVRAGVIWGVLISGLVGVVSGAEEPPPARSAIGTWAFTVPSSTESRPALLDLRELNEKVAGQSGFIRRTSNGAGFALGDGTPVRFWAVGSEIYDRSPGEIARHVRFLARLGVNLVRLHTQIAPKGTGNRISDVDTKQIDGIWRFVAAARKQGIYTAISPYWANGKDAGSWGIASYSGTTDLWGLLFFNKTLQAGYKGWVRALYTRTNPYTGITLAQDPGVALIQIQNEDSLLFWTTQGLKPPQRELLGQSFAAWLTRKYRSLDAAKQAWAGAGHQDDDFDHGRVGLLSIWPMTQPQSGGMARRVSDELMFYAQTQREFYAEMANFYRQELGCRQLINASNWKTADPIRLDDVERWTYTATDVIAVNRYYNGGAHQGSNSGWRIDPGDHFSQQSALLDPRSLPTNLKQVAGYPMIVSESTWVTPLAYQSEGPFLVAVYQALTGQDAFCWFTASEPEYATDPFFNFANVGGQHPLFKWSASIPTIMGGFPAAALMYRRGDIKQGEPVVHEERAMEGLWNREPPILAEGPSFDPNRDRGTMRPAGLSNTSSSVDPLAFLVGPIEVKYGGDPARTRVLDLSRYIDHQNRLVRSNTGEITLDYGKGLCTLNTPRAQGACGFMARTGVIRLRDVAIRSRNGYATVIVVSLDDQPLATSTKVLVQVGTSARPTGWNTHEAEFPAEDGKTTLHGFEVIKTGTPPWRIIDTEVSLVVRNPFLIKATRLDSAGYPAESVPTRRDGNDLAIQLPLNTMYLVLEPDTR